MSASTSGAISRARRTCFPDRVPGRRGRAATRWRRLGWGTARRSGPSMLLKKKNAIPTGTWSRSHSASLSATSGSKGTDRARRAVVAPARALTGKQQIAGSARAQQAARVEIDYVRVLVHESGSRTSRTTRPEAAPSNGAVRSRAATARRSG